MGNHSGWGRATRGAYSVLIDFLARRDRLRGADAIVAFGGRALMVADRAAALHRAGWAPWVVATGGVPFDDERTEAEAFADRMVARGVPRERILIEDSSRHTGENVQFSLELLRTVIGSPRALIAAPHPFAARRAAATVRCQAPAVDLVCAPDPGFGGTLNIPNGPRARLALSEFSRLDRYAAAGHIAPEAIPYRVRIAASALASAFGDPRSQVRAHEPVLAGAWASTPGL